MPWVPSSFHHGEVTGCHNCKCKEFMCEEFFFFLFFLFFMSTVELRCKTSSIRTRTTRVRWSAAGTPGMETRIRQVSSRRWQQQLIVCLFDTRSHDTLNVSGFSLAVNSLAEHHRETYRHPNTETRAHDSLPTLVLHQVDLYIEVIARRWR